MTELSFETYNLANARDLGGIAVENGGVIKPGLLIRSCALGQATAQEVEALDQAYHLRHVIDLRAEDEARKDPDPLQLLPQAQYLNIPLAADEAVGIVRKGGLREGLALMKRMSNDPVGMMTEMYRDIITSERGQAALAQVFDVLLQANGSCVLWHCTAGKDRAGITAAVILLALGASREDIYADYELTNQFMAPYLEKQQKQLRFAPAKVKQSLAVMNQANPVYLDAAFDAIHQGFGTVDAYLATLGLDAAKLQKLRQIYTQPV